MVSCTISGTRLISSAISHLRSTTASGVVVRPPEAPIYQAPPMGLTSAGIPVYNDVDDDIRYHCNNPTVIANPTYNPYYRTCPPRHALVILLLTLAQVTLAATIAVTWIASRVMSGTLIDYVKTGRIDYVIQHLRMSAGSVSVRSPRDGTNALYWAACIGDPVMCDVLLQHGAEVNSSACQWGSRPLHVAADRGREEVAMLFIKWGADVNAQTSNRLDTPLHNAAYRGHYELCLLLVTHGADVIMVNRDGRTAREEAQGMNHHWTSKYLLDRELKVRADGGPTRLAVTSALHRPLHKLDSHPISVTAPISRLNDTDPSVHNHNRLGEQVSNGGTALGDKCITETHHNKEAWLETEGEHETGARDGLPYYEAQPTDDLGIYQVNDKLNERLKPAITVSNNGVLNLDRDYGSSLHILTNKLQNLELFTGKLQVALTRYRDRESHLRTENEHLKQVISSTGDLEAQLSAARSEIARQFERQHMDETQLNELRRQVREMKAKYKSLQVEYTTLYQTHGRQASDTSSDDASDSSSIIIGRGSDYDADCEVSRDGGSCVAFKLSGRGVGDSSSSGSSGSGSPVTSPKSREHKTSDSTSDTKLKQRQTVPEQTTSPEHRVTSSTVVPAANTTLAPPEEIPGSHSQQLRCAVAPVFAMAGREFMDMLSASLLYQVRNDTTPTIPQSPVLDTENKVWVPGVDFTFDSSAKPWISNVDETELPTSVLCRVIREGVRRTLKMTSLDLRENSPQRCRSQELLHLQSTLYSSASHDNVSRVLHRFTSGLRADISLPLPQKVLQDLSTATYSVTQHYPANLYSLLKVLKSHYTDAAEALPERFVLHLLYGLLSGVEYLHGVGIVHGDLCTANVALTSNLRPVIEHSDFGIQLQDSVGNDIVITERTQVVRRFNRRVPPELSEARLQWKDVIRDKVTCRQLVTPGDLFCLGAMMFSMLRSGWKKVSASATSAFPSGFSGNLHSLLYDMVRENPKHRPTLTQAKTRVGIMLYGPVKNEVTSFNECQIWHHTRMIGLLMPCANCGGQQKQQSSHCDFVQTITSSITGNDAILEKDYLTSACAAQVWEGYKQLDWRPPS